MTADYIYSQILIGDARDGIFRLGWLCEYLAEAITRDRIKESYDTELFHGCIESSIVDLDNTLVLSDDRLFVSPRIVPALWGEWLGEIGKYLELLPLYDVNSARWVTGDMKNLTEVVKALESVQRTVMGDGYGEPA